VGRAAGQNKHIVGIDVQWLSRPVFEPEPEGTRHDDVECYDAFGIRHDAISNPFGARRDTAKRGTRIHVEEDRSS